MTAWVLLLTGCVWVPSSELDLRWAELIDADSDGYDDAAYGGDDCDDGDPTVHPGAVEGLGDELDSDCDGEPDGSAWTAVDLRGSQGVQGPRLALGDDTILLAWQAETLEGDATLHDGFGLLGLSVDDPTGPELGARLVGEVEDAGHSGPFDMDAVGGTVILGLSSWTEQERIIEMHGLPEDLSSHSSAETVPVAGQPFHTLQAGVPGGDYPLIVGCGRDGAGIHGVAAWTEELLAGGAQLAIDEPITGDGHDFGVCEVDPLYESAIANNHPDDTSYKVYRFDRQLETFSYDYSAFGGFGWADNEITDEHEFSLQMLLDELTNRVLVFYIAPQFNTSFLETWIVLPTGIVDGDTCPGSSGESYACVVDDGGGVTIYWSDLWEQGSGAPIHAFTPEQDELGELLECGLVVTAEDLLVLAVRGEQGIWLNRFVRASSG